MDNDYNIRYTKSALVEELALLERHYRDGSWRDCTCIPEKHLPTIAGLSSEMIMFVKPDKEKQFYEELADWARAKRLAIEDGAIFEESHEDHISHALAKCLKSNSPDKCKALINEEKESV